MRRATVIEREENLNMVLRLKRTFRSPLFLLTAISAFVLSIATGYCAAAVDLAPATPLVQELARDVIPLAGQECGFRPRP